MLAAFAHQQSMRVPKIFKPEKTSNLLSLIFYPNSSGTLTHPHYSPRKHSPGSPWHTFACQVFWHRSCRGEMESRFEAACTLCSIHNLYFPSLIFLLASYFFWKPKWRLWASNTCICIPLPNSARKRAEVFIPSKGKTLLIADLNPHHMSRWMLINGSIKIYESEPLAELVLRGWQWHGPGSPARSSQDSRA